MPQRDPIATFQLVTGQPPYDYQRVLCARALPPQVVEVPTGSSKTLAALIPWLCDAHAPRRLVYALPMRSLVEQTARVVRDVLEAADNLDVAVHVLMGGVEDAGWRVEPEGRAVLVGTIDMLLSRALGRG
jgi:CRISPR-associated endonuclease/helicase Cas3